MNETVLLKKPNLPKMIGELVHSNQFLKIFAIASLSTGILAVVALLVALTKDPTVLPLAVDGTAVERMTVLPKAEDQVEAAVRRYMGFRYQWNAKTVQGQIKMAENFVPKESQKAYEAATAQIVKFSTEKQVSQKVFPEQPVVHLAEKTVSIGGDRVTEIQGMRAIGALKLTLFFEGGPRTPENPWGVYIVREKEEQ